MGTFRNLMIIFGMLFCVLVLTFAIGMFFPGFRQGLYNTLSVVPTATYNTTAEELAQAEETLTSLRQQKTTLETNLATLQSSNTANEAEIEELEQQLADLNEEIEELESLFTTISNNVGGAQIAFDKLVYCINYAEYDNNNTAVILTGESFENIDYYRNGVAIVDKINRYNLIKNALEKGISLHDDNAKVSYYNRYNVFLGNEICTFQDGYKTYYFDNNATINLEYKLNNSIYSFENILNEINNNGNYSYAAKVDYVLNDNNQITNLKMTITIKSLGGNQ